MGIVVAVLLGLLYGNFIEWFAHKYVLHGLGKKRSSLWSFHFHEHHKLVRKWKGGDPQYLNFEFGPEWRALSLLTLAHVPLFFFFPIFSGTLVVHSVMYYMLHRKSHLDPVWAKKWMPWHYDHHMGKNQDANWGVTTDIWDTILNTKRR